jgi:hypothetical protein
MSAAHVFLCIALLCCAVFLAFVLENEISAAFSNLLADPPSFALGLDPLHLPGSMASGNVQFDAG